MASSILYTITQPPSIFGIDPVNGEEKQQFIHKIRALVLKEAPTSGTSLTFEDTKHLYGTIIEFPLYTTLPTYHVLYEVEYKKERVLIYLESISKPLEVPSGKKDYGMKTNAIVAVVLSPSPHYRTSGTDHDVYDLAEVCTNDLIKSYKLMPQRHNHDLEPITNTRVSPVSTILHFSVLGETIKNQSGTSLLTSFNSIVNNTTNQKALTDEQVYILSRGSLAFAVDEKYIEPIYRLVRARDLNCIGDYGLSIILSASAGEGFLAALEHEIRTKHLGEDDITAKASIDNRYLSDFKRFAKEYYNLPTGNSSKYKIWYKGSYLLRNDFIHKQSHSHLPQHSNHAIHSTINLLIEAIDLAVIQYRLPHLNHIKEVLLGLSNAHPTGTDSVIKTAQS